MCVLAVVSFLVFIFRAGTCMNARWAVQCWVGGAGIMFSCWVVGARVAQGAADTVLVGGVVDCLRVIGGACS